MDSIQVQTLTTGEQKKSGKIQARTLMIGTKKMKKCSSKKRLKMMRNRYGNDTTLRKEEKEIKLEV